MAISVCLLFKFVKFSAFNLFVSLQRSAGMLFLCYRVSRFSSSYVCALYFGSRFLQAFPKGLQELFVSTCTPSSTLPFCLSPHLNLDRLSAFTIYTIASNLHAQGCTGGINWLKQARGCSAGGRGGGIWEESGEGMTVNTMQGTRVSKICDVPI